MKLNEWLSKAGNSQERLAAAMTAIGPRITQGAISQWKDRDGVYRVPPDRVLQVERATNAEVHRSDSRPDLYPPEEYAA